LKDCIRNNPGQFAIARQSVATDARLGLHVSGLNSNSIRPFTKRTGSGTNLPRRFGTACSWPKYSIP
jgi:hypothetical protein